MTAPIYPPGDLVAVRRSYLEGAQVGFREAVEQAFRNKFVYRGRASRSAYWWFSLFQCLVIFAIDIVIAVLPVGGTVSNSPSGPGIIEPIVLGLVSICLAAPNLALTVRRLHDTDHSGWWQLIVIVPFVGAIVLFIFTLLRGTPGPNRYQP
jgi:uncharacterized membrane protein YhaH (DUF805 family)